ncbi:MAG: DUF1211 domain-containing protein [Anaerolineae bacterium]|nr:DUF1211 domain-containing protein [Anaerolineae bacterium]
MLRKPLIERRVGESSQFRWRGEEVSRIEGLSDAVFAFSITLIVISLEVPKTFDDLLSTMNGAAGFAISFFLLMGLWYSHYLFFRRYGLKDSLTIILNNCLLFVVLLYVFPLKFLATLLIDEIIGLPTESLIRTEQIPSLMIIYGIGFIAVYVIFSLMYYNAYRQRERLELNESEQLDTLSTLLSHVSFAITGFVSVVIAVIGGLAWSSLAGFAYPIMILILRTAVGFWIGNRRRRLRHSLEAKTN